MPCFMSQMQTLCSNHLVHEGQRPLSKPKLNRKLEKCNRSLIPLCCVLSGAASLMFTSFEGPAYIVRLSEGYFCKGHFRRCCCC